MTKIKMSAVPLQISSLCSNGAHTTFNDLSGFRNENLQYTRNAYCRLATDKTFSLIFITSYLSHKFIKQNIFKFLMLYNKVCALNWLVQGDKKVSVQQMIVL